MTTTSVIPKSGFRMQTEKSSNEITIHCSGRLVSDTCEEFQQTVRGLIRTTGLIGVDLSNVNYIDSSALGAIVGLHLASKHVGCQLKLINLTQQVKKLLSMTRLMEVLEGHAKQELFGQIRE